MFVVFQILQPGAYVKSEEVTNNWTWEHSLSRKQQEGAWDYEEILDKSLTS